MSQYYSDDTHIYSVDMMFAYIHKHKPPTVLVATSNLKTNLEYDCWADPITNIQYSPMAVITNPELYPNEYTRIVDVDLAYPIILFDDLLLSDLPLSDAGL